MLIYRITSALRTCASDFRPKKENSASSLSNARLRQHTTQSSDTINRIGNKETQLLQATVLAVDILQ
jgi:hypothetical protein